LSVREAAISGFGDQDAGGTGRRNERRRFEGTVKRAMTAAEQVGAQVDDHRTDAGKMVGARV